MTSLGDSAPLKLAYALKSMAVDALKSMAADA